MTQQIDMTKGNIASGIFRFSIPLMLGNVLQQFYNIADTLVVGRFIGKQALAAVGSAYSLMIFLTSVILGFSMGSGAFLSIQYGRRDEEALCTGNFMSFVMIGGAAVFINGMVYLFMDPILCILQIPPEVMPAMRSYLVIIYGGILATFLYNYAASSLRAIGNSVIPLYFLAASAILNVILDIMFVAGFHWGIVGAAAATVLSQYVSGIGITIYTWKRLPILRFQKPYMRFRKHLMKPIGSLALLTSVQQSIMNFGILMVQGRVNSFGTEVMAAFAAAVKVDTFAYSPVQDFGNAFSTFVAQNYGAKNRERIRKGGKLAVLTVLGFCVIVSGIVVGCSEFFIGIFTADPEIIRIGVSYLRTEGVFYCLIGFLFLFYGYFRAIEKPTISIVLTIASLGTRVILAYTLSALPTVGYYGIWVSIPIGWALADLLGIVFLSYSNVWKRIYRK